MQKENKEKPSTGFVSKINPKPDPKDRQKYSLTFDLMVKEFEQIEALAAIDHDQWCYWSQNMIPLLDEMAIAISDLNKALLKSDPKYNGSKLHNQTQAALKKYLDTEARWQSFWCAYKQLPESVKESDRVWAKKEYDLITKKK